MAQAAVRKLVPVGMGAVGRGTRARAAATAVRTDGAPAPLGPYSQAIRSGETLYVSGCIGLVPGTKDFAKGGVEGETEQVMANMGAPRGRRPPPRRRWQPPRWHGSSPSSFARGSLRPRRRR